MKKYQVNLIKAGRVEVWGTYSSKETAEKQAEPHRGTGYWDTVTVTEV